MSKKRGSPGAQVAAMLATFVAASAARQLIEFAWKRVTGKEPPSDPHDPHVRVSGLEPVEHARRSSAGRTTLCVRKFPSRSAIMKILKIACCAFVLAAAIGCKGGGGGGGGGWKAAVGDSGTIVETFDDASWDVHKVTDHDLRAVSCINNEIGWAAGSKGFIGHTIDGGWSWPAQDSGVDAELNAISFPYGG